ncbi:MAG: insulinase family protein, partial [Candidatus Omnitrophica bacterium]|nr:insulinase family protein [Candidatus Omnitrophota bacterium]
EMRMFYAAQYVPNNIVISCVGDLDASTFPALLREIFGSWPRGAPYVPHVPPEPPAVSMKQVEDELSVQVAYAMIGFPSVRLSDPDLYPLDVLANVVGQGHSARLYEQLVRTRHLAHSIGAGNYTPFDPGVFTVALRADPNQVTPAVDAVFDVLDSVKEGGVTPEELKKAKRQVVAGYVFQRQTIESKAGDLANSLALTGDPMFSKRYVEGVEGVTEEQVKHAARRYLDRRYATLAIIRPSNAQAAGQPPAPEVPLQAKKTVLPNGLTVLTGVNRHLPMAVIVAGCRGGVRVETETTQGLSSLVAQLLVKGTSRRSATEIATFVESLGGVLEPFSGRDGFGLSLQLLAEDLDAGLVLMQELLTDSTMPNDELELQRQLVLKELDARDDDIFDVAGRRLRETLFLSHPYRFDPLGSRASISRLTRDECLAFAKQRLTPSNLVLAVFGDIQDTRVLSDIQQRFGKLPIASSSWPQDISAEPLDQVRRATVTLPKEQTIVMLGFRGSRLNAEDRDSLDVLTAILSGMSGRLFQTVREQQGLAYTLGAFNVAGWDPGYLVVYAATRPDARERVVAMLCDQLQVLVKRGVSQEELDQAKRYLIGSHRLELQHLSGVARRGVLDELYGLGYDAWTQDERRINAVTASMVQDAAKRYLTLSQRADVIVGPDTAPLNGQEMPVPTTRKRKEKTALKSGQPVGRAGP